MSGWELRELLFRSHMARVKDNTPGLDTSHILSHPPLLRNTISITYPWSHEPL